MSRVSSLGPLTSTREPFLIRPFQAGVTGWIVVFGAIIAEQANGALTCNDLWRAQGGPLAPGRRSGT